MPYTKYVHGAQQGCEDIKDVSPTETDNKTAEMVA